MAQEAIVRLVAVAVNDAGLDLSADAALRADAAAPHAAGQDVGIPADVAGTFQAADVAGTRSATRPARLRLCKCEPVRVAMPALS
jgi:hypothetical protein